MNKGFVGDRAFLSNFFPVTIFAMGKEWPSSEHLYQAMKTVDPVEREAVRVLPRPATTKKFGKSITLRPDWEQIRIEVMRDVVRAKFQQNPALAMQLVETRDDVLVEHNWWHDNFWGVCNCQSCQDAPKARNELGKILMAVRAELLTMPVIRDQVAWRW